MNERSEKMNKISREFLRTEHGIDLPQGLKPPLASHDAFAQPTVEKTIELAPGIVFRQHAISLENNRFTNSFEVRIATNAARIGIFSAPRPMHLHKVLTVERPDAVTCINGGFFFLADQAEKRPIEATYNFCVRDGHVVSLPSINRPALMVTKDSGDIVAQELKAKGEIEIGKQRIPWKGAHPANNKRGGKAPALLYNSACCSIVYKKDPVSGTRRVLDMARNTTPRDPARTDIVVGVRNKELYVREKRRGGQTDFFEGAFILNVSNDAAQSMEVGALVKPVSVDNIRVENIAEAVTIGPAIADGTKNLARININNDPSLANQPFLNDSSPRSVVYKTKDGALSLRIFDGARKSKAFSGVTPREVYEILQREHRGNIEWGFHIDPGQSVRLMVRHPFIGGDHEKVVGYGNLHYERWPHADAPGIKKLPDHHEDRFFLDATRARPTTSALYVIPKK